MVLVLLESTHASGTCRPTCLLIVPAVQVAQLPHESGVYEAIGAYQVVRQGGLAVVHVCQDAHVAQASLRQCRSVSCLVVELIWHQSAQAPTV